MLPSRWLRGPGRWSEFQPVNQSFDFVLGPADQGDRNRVAMLQHSERGLTENARSNIFVKVFAHEVLGSHRDLVRLLIGGKSLGLCDFTDGTEVLNSFLQSGISGR